MSDYETFDEIDRVFGEGNAEELQVMINEAISRHELGSEDFADVMSCLYMMMFL